MSNLDNPLPTPLHICKGSTQHTAALPTFVRFYQNQFTSKFDYTHPSEMDLEPVLDLYRSASQRNIYTNIMLRK